MSATASPKPKKLLEHESGYDRVDRDAGIIYGVKVLGLVSRNGRRYRESAVAAATHCYEGAVVNIDHLKIDPNSRVNPERSITDRWGVLRNVRMQEGGLYADLHFLKHHPMTEFLLEAAERFPETFGLSHDASGDERLIDGVREVVEIYRVNSVDVVSKPATNDGLFESVQTQEGFCATGKGSGIDNSCSSKDGSHGAGSGAAPAMGIKAAPTAKPVAPIKSGASLTARKSHAERVKKAAASGEANQAKAAARANAATQKKAASAAKSTAKKADASRTASLKKATSTGSIKAPKPEKALKAPKSTGPKEPKPTVMKAHKTAKPKSDLIAVRSNNQTGGFHGAMAANSSGSDPKKALKAAGTEFSKTAHALVDAGHFSNARDAGKYLDSKAGAAVASGLKDAGGDASKIGWLGRNAQEFKRSSQMAKVDAKKAGAPTATSYKGSSKDNRSYADKVSSFEKQGMTTSDAQSVVDLQMHRADPQSTIGKPKGNKVSQTTHSAANPSGHRNIKPQSKPFDTAGAKKFEVPDEGAFHNKVNMWKTAGANVRMVGNRAHVIGDGGKVIGYLDKPNQESEKRVIDMTTAKYSDLIESNEQFSQFLEDAMGGDPMIGGTEVALDDSMDATGQMIAAFKAAMEAVLDDESLETQAKLAKLKAIMVAKEKALEAIGEASGSDGDMGGAMEPDADTEVPDDVPVDDSTAPGGDMSIAAGAEDEVLDEEDDTIMPEEFDESHKEVAECNGKKCAKCESLAEIMDENSRLLEENRTLSVRMLLLESGCEVSDVRVKALAALSESERPALIDTWGKKRTITESAKQRPARSPSVLTESDASSNVVAYPKTREEFARALG